MIDKVEISYKSPSFYGDYIIKLQKRQEDTTQRKEMRRIYIHEAVEKAMEIDGYMYLIVDGVRTGYMKPSETSCILYRGNKKSPSGWQPRASQLMSDKWEIISEKSYELLSQLNKLS